MKKSLFDEKILEQKVNKTPFYQKSLNVKSM